MSKLNFFPASIIITLSTIRICLLRSHLIFLNILVRGISLFSSTISLKVFELYITQFIILTKAARRALFIPALFMHIKIQFLLLSLQPFMHTSTTRFTALMSYWDYGKSIRFGINVQNAFSRHIGKTSRPVLKKFGSCFKMMSKQSYFMWIQTYPDRDLDVI